MSGIGNENGRDALRECTAAALGLNLADIGKGC